MVDVLSGELFYAETGGRRGVVVPAKNPETGIRSIIPVQVSEEGEVAIGPRYLDIVGRISDEQEQTISDAINQTTWVVVVDPESAKRYTR